MPRKSLVELQTSEAASNSPLRRSTRIASTPSEITMKKNTQTDTPRASTRKKSVSLEPDEKSESKPAPRTRRASTLAEEEAKKEVTSSPSRRTRKSSLNGSDEKKVIEKPKAAVRGRRNSAADSTDKETKKESTRNRRSMSADIETANAKATPKRTTNSQLKKNTESEKTPPKSTKEKPIVAQKQEKPKTVSRNLQRSLAERESDDSTHSPSRSLTDNDLDQNEKPTSVNTTPMKKNRMWDKIEADLDLSIINESTDDINNSKLEKSISIRKTNEGELKQTEGTESKTSPKISLNRKRTSTSPIVEGSPRKSPRLNAKKVEETDTNAQTEILSPAGSETGDLDESLLLNSSSESVSNKENNTPQKKKCITIALTKIDSVKQVLPFENSTPNVEPMDVDLSISELAGKADTSIQLDESITFSPKNSICNPTQLPEKAIELDNDQHDNSKTVASSLQNDGSAKSKSEEALVPNKINKEKETICKEKSTSPTDKNKIESKEKESKKPAVTSPQNESNKTCQNSELVSSETAGEEKEAKPQNDSSQKQVEKPEALNTQIQNNKTSPKKGSDKISSNINKKLDISNQEDSEIILQEKVDAPIQSEVATDTENSRHEINVNVDDALDCEITTNRDSVATPDSEADNNKISTNLKQNSSEQVKKITIQSEPDEHQLNKVSKSCDTEVVVNLSNEENKLSTEVRLVEKPFEPDNNKLENTATFTSSNTKSPQKEDSPKKHSKEESENSKNLEPIIQSKIDQTTVEETPDTTQEEIKESENTQVQDSSEKSENSTNFEPVIKSKTKQNPIQDAPDSIQTKVKESELTSNKFKIGSNAESPRMHDSPEKPSTDQKIIEYVSNQAEMKELELTSYEFNITSDDDETFKTDDTSLIKDSTRKYSFEKKIAEPTTEAKSDTGKINSLQHEEDKKINNENYNASSQEQDSLDLTEETNEVNQHIEHDCDKNDNDDQKLDSQKKFLIGINKDVVNCDIEGKMHECIQQDSDDDVVISENEIDPDKYAEKETSQEITQSTVDINLVQDQVSPNKSLDLINKSTSFMDVNTREHTNDNPTKESVVEDAIDTQENNSSPILLSTTNNDVEKEHVAKNDSKNSSPRESQSELENNVEDVSDESNTSIELIFVEDEQTKPECEEKSVDRSMNMSDKEEKKISTLSNHLEHNETLSSNSSNDLEHNETLSDCDTEPCSRTSKVDSDIDEDVSYNDFIDNMAEEGEEDTPSEDSNQIIDEGESVGSTDIEEGDSEDDYENDSFICDDEQEELLSGDGDDLDYHPLAKTGRRRRIISAENLPEGDIINISNEKKKAVKKKSRIIKVSSSSSDEDDQAESISSTIPSESKTDIVSIKESVKSESNDDDYEVNDTDKADINLTSNEPDAVNLSSKLHMKCAEHKGKRSSLNIQENILLDGSKDQLLSKRINTLVDTFCSSVSKGEIALNLSLEYEQKNVYIEKVAETSDNKNCTDSESKLEIDELEELSASVNQVTDLREILSEKALKRRLSKSMDDLRAISSKKRKTKKPRKEKSPENRCKKSAKNERAKLSLNLIDQLVTDVKNRQRRTVKPSQPQLEVAAWTTSKIKNLKPSTTPLTLRELTKTDQTKFHPKDFKNQMLSDNSRIKRINTATLLKKKGVHF